LTAVAISICILCQFLLVSGQLFLKHAMNAVEQKPRVRSRIIRNFAFGITLLTGWFLLWVGLLQEWELSRIFPFEGINPAVLVIAAWFFLKERIPAQAWVGVALICVGIALVTGS
jgi:uncharacterized membrane protein